MGSQIDISVRLGNLVLRNPFIVGSGPTTKHLDQLKRAKEAGWAGASLKLAIHPEPYISLPPRYRWLPKRKLHIFTAETRLTQSEALSLLEAGCREIDDFLILPNITYDGTDLGGWAEMAIRFENAGAEALELNMCCPNMSYNVNVSGSSMPHATGASLGSDLDRLADVVASVVRAVRIPVIVKLTPEGGRIAEAAEICYKAGALAAGGTGNRLGIADFDVRNPASSLFRLQKQNTLSCLSGQWLTPLALRDTYEIRKRLGNGALIIAAGGIATMEDAVRQIMAGADALWVCTETIVQGFRWLPKLLEQLYAYMGEMGFSRLDDMRNLLHRTIAPAAELDIRQGHAVVDRDTCIACGRCWDLGHCSAISHNGGVTAIDPGRCMGCSTCVDVCPKGAISMVPLRGVQDERKG